MGWIDKYIKQEVNSVKSDFNQKHFVFLNVNNIESGVDRFIDYVLLGEDFSVLAIIESKRYSLDEEKGRIQARTYSKDIEMQVNRKIPIFLTNGTTWRFIDEDGIERKVSGPFSQEDLKQEINERRPVIILIDPSHIYGGVGGFGHFIVIVGFKDGEIVYHDPDEPDGEYMKCDLETFLLAWNATRCWMVKIEKE